MKKAILVFLFSYCATTSWAQVGIGTTTPVNSAALEIKDTARGLLIPRMTMVQRNAISTAATGLMIYQTDSTKGFWYFDGAIWKNVNASSNYGGKHTLILSDTITNAQAQAKIAMEFGPNTQEIRIEGCLYLTSVDLSMFNTASNITITDNPLLQTINLGNLKTCDGYFSFNNCPVLTSLNLNSLEKILYRSTFDIAAFYFNKTGLITINCPKLKRVLGVVSITYNPSLTSISFPLITEEIAVLGITDNNALSNISFPLLKTMGLLNVFRCNALTSLTFPSLTGITHGASDYYETWVQDCPNLNSISFDNLVVFNNYGFECNLNTQLTSAGINYLLHKFATITPAITGRQFFLHQTPAAPPTGQGLIDKATLMANGNAVVTD